MIHHSGLVMTSLPVFLPFSLINNMNYNHNGVKTRPLLSTTTWVNSSRLLCHGAVGRESSSSEEEEEGEKFEVDTDKARQALQKLDQQLLSLSEKQLNPPNNSRAKYLDRPQPPDREEAPDFSGSFLPFSAFALLLFSIFYNVIFITVIKPSIDLP